MAGVTLPEIGYRGYKLARTAMWMGFGIIVLSFASMVWVAAFSPDHLVSMMPWAASLIGIGVGGQYAGNVAEKWGGKNTPE